MIVNGRLMAKGFNAGIASWLPTLEEVIVVMEGNNKPPSRPLLSNA